MAILTPLGASCLLRNLVIQSRLISKSEKSWREFLVLSRNPRNIARSHKISRCTLLGQVHGSEMAQKPALPAVWPITVRHLSATDPAISVMVQAPGLTVGWAIPDPFISNWLDHLLHLSKRFCEEVCDCVCWYVNRADNTNRWHWVQEAVLVFSHILLSKIYQSIWY